MHHAHSMGSETYWGRLSIWLLEISPFYLSQFLFALTQMVTPGHLQMVPSAQRYLTSPSLRTPEFYKSCVCDYSLIPFRHNKWISTSSLTQISLLTVLTWNGVDREQSQFNTMSCERFNKPLGRWPFQPAERDPDLWSLKSSPLFCLCEFWSGMEFRKK